MNNTQAINYSISEVVVSSGQAIPLSQGELLVIVGPNNSGKSSFLREIVHFGEGQPVGPVIEECKSTRNGSYDQFCKWLENNVHCGENSSYSWINASFSARNAKLGKINWDSQSSRSEHSRFFVTLADTKSRLGVVDPATPISASGKPSHPLHVLFNDQKLEEQLSSYFKRTFDTELVLQRVGAKIGLHCCNRSDVGDSVNASLLELPKFPALEEQGDGMKSFAGTIISLITSPGFIHLIDEPEAFLHPPQARELGKIIAEIQDANPSKQIVVSTHSGDFLRGIAESSPKKLKIARLSRSSDISNDVEVNNVQLLDIHELETLWSDPVLRFSHALNAVFHEASIICEYEADCQFFSAIAEAAVPTANRPDVMYIGAGGKAGMKKLVKALVALGVPTAVIVDFDILNGTDPLKELYKELGGDWGIV